MTDPTPTLEQLLGLDAEESTETKPTGKDLRSQLQAVLAERNALKEQLAQSTARERVRTAAELVAKHNIPPLAQNLLLKETEGDLTDESVTAFVAQYGELWGAKAAEASTTPEQQASTAAVQALSNSAGPPPGGLLDEDAYRSQYAEAKTKEDVMRMAAEAARGYVVGME
jgi:hypothetical protein